MTPNAVNIGPPMEMRFRPRPEAIQTVEHVRSITKTDDALKPGPAIDIRNDLYIADVSPIEDCKNFFQLGLPWKWLITNFSSLMRLSWPDGGWKSGVLKTVRANLDSELRCQRTTSCYLAWDPIPFLEIHRNQDVQSRLGEFVTLLSAHLSLLVATPEIHLK